MNSLRLLPVRFVALVMSIGVTAGSLYVTVDAAFRRAPSEVPEPAAMVTESASDVSMIEVPLAVGGVFKVRFSAISTPTGVLLPSAGLDVTLIGASRLQIRGTSDADGLCSFADLSPGLYTITAKGVQGRVSHGVRLTAPDQPLAGQHSRPEWMPASVGLDVVLDSALTAARDNDAIDRIINSVTVTPFKFGATGVAEKATETLPVQIDGLQDDSTFTGHKAIELNGNGSLNGQVAMLDPVTGQTAQVTDLSVSFVTDNRVVAETRVNPDGTFVQANLLPGVYSMVVAGKDGIGYMGVDVVGSLAAAAGQETIIPVRMETRAGLAFGMLQGAGASAAASGSDDKTDKSDDSDESTGNEGAESDASNETSRRSPAGGAPAGTSLSGIGAGGESPGSGGGLGVALGLAGGAAAALLASDDDDARPASPAR
jgi:hypothetical protein